jgi:drug/metabolite transporter (DMT)-like permease
VGWRRWASILVGFAGVLVILERSIRRATVACVVVAPFLTLQSVLVFSMSLGVVFLAERGRCTDAGYYAGWRR